MNIKRMQINLLFLCLLASLLCDNISLFAISLGSCPLPYLSSGEHSILIKTQDCICWNRLIRQESTAHHLTGHESKYSSFQKQSTFQNALIIQFYRIYSWHIHLYEVLEPVSASCGRRDPHLALPLYDDDGNGGGRPSVLGWEGPVTIPQDNDLKED